MVSSSRFRAHRRWASSALAAGALGACGCFPAPGPTPPPRGALEVGADYRPQAVNRWVCKSDGSIVLSQRGSRPVLHFENLDWVLDGHDAGDFVRFSFSTAAGTLAVDWATTTLAPSETVYLASKTRGGDFVIKRGLAQGTVDEKCKWEEL